MRGRACIKSGTIHAAHSLWQGRLRPRRPARAAAYSVTQEDALRRFLADPKVNIDNNPCENAVRPFCLGRKNWLFVGGDNGGTSMAVLASFAATCKDNGVDFEKWLGDVILRLDTCPASGIGIGTLLPHNWKPAD